MTSRALEDFRRSYLEEVRQYLANDEQFALLSNYEATEFKAELGPAAVDGQHLNTRR